MPEYQISCFSPARPQGYMYSMRDIDAYWMNCE